MQHKINDNSGFIGYIIIKGADKVVHIYGKFAATYMNGKRIMIDKYGNNTVF